MSNRPIILDYAQPRRGSDAVKFFYDRESDMNLVKTASGVYPFIDSDEKCDLELYTKTKIDRESDDDEAQFALRTDLRDNIAEMITKTDTIRESDDEVHWQLELLTKTYADRESDDEDPRYAKELYL